MRTNVLFGVFLTILALLLVVAARPESGPAAEAVKRIVKIEASDVGQGTIILGDLGLPIGEEVTIEGKKIADSHSVRMFLVDAVNYEKLAEPTLVHVNGIQKWPVGTVATLRGFEVGTIRFVHIEDTGLDEDATFEKYQAIGLRFCPTDVLKPKDLEFDPEGWTP